MSSSGGSPPPPKRMSPSWGFLHVTLPGGGASQFCQLRRWCMWPARVWLPKIPRPPHPAASPRRSGVKASGYSTKRRTSWLLCWQTAAATGFHMRVLSRRRRTAVPAGPHLSVRGGGATSCTTPHGGNSVVLFCDTTTYHYLHRYARTRGGTGQTPQASSARQASELETVSGLRLPFIALCDTRISSYLAYTDKWF